MSEPINPDTAGPRDPALAPKREHVPARPVASTQSAAFFVRLRENLRSRLFGTTELPPTSGSTPPPAQERREEDLPSHVGRYEVLGRIGSGGMGVIYSAFDLDLGRKVAVKLLNPRGAHGEQARQRLLREAKALAKLSHPAIVHVYEVGTFQSQVYVAMEFVQGVTLRQWQSAAERSWRSVLAAYARAASGLAAGHAAGIVHRDFKPDNVLVGDDGGIRVIDFGLARTGAEAVPLEVDEAIDPRHLEGDIALTKTGTLMGTPAYMTPEQFRGETADARTDQFSFCVALYEALYGFRPFAGTTVHQLATNVLAGAVEPPPRYTDVPERVYKVLLRGLEVDPVERYANMQQLLDDLPSEAPRVLPWLVGGLVVAGTMVVAGGLGYSKLEDLREQERLDEIRSQYVEQRGADAELALRRSWGRTQTHRFNELVLRTAETLVDSNPTEALASLKRLDRTEPEWLTPARLIGADAASEEVVAQELHLSVGPINALAADHTGDRLVIGAGRLGALTYPRPRSVAGLVGEPGLLRGGDFDVTSVGVSADGMLIVAGGRDGVARLWTDPDGEATTWHRRKASITAVAVSNDGRRVVVGDATGHVAMGRPIAGVEVGAMEHAGAVISVALSPDGDTLASAGDDNKIRVSFIKEKKRWELPHRTGVKVVQLSFSHNGQFIECLGSDGWVWRVRTDDRRGAIVDRITGVTAFSQPASGDTMAAYGPGQALRVYQGENKPPRELDARGVVALAMSGDGQTVISAGVDNTVRYWKIRRKADRIYDLGDAVVLSMAHDPTTDSLAIGGSGGSVRVRDAAGEEWRSTGQLMGGVHALSFSPDGRRLAALGGLGGITVWTLDSNVDPLSLLPAAFVSPIRWSSDGTRLAASQCESPRRCALVVHDVDRDERLLSTDLGPPLRAFSMSQAARFAVGVRRTNTDSMAVYDLQTGEHLGVPWPENDRPYAVVAYAFGPNASYIRIATIDEGRLRLWHWVPAEELLVALDETEVESAKPDSTGRALLLRTADGDDLWVLGETLRRPLGPLPERIDYLELSLDGDALLVLSDGRATIIHPATGVRRTISGITFPFVWRGLSGFATSAEPSVVRLRDDPTPGDPVAFAQWLEEITDAQPRTGLGTE